MSQPPASSILFDGSPWTAVTALCSCLKRGLLQAIVRGMQSLPGGVLLEANRFSSQSSANPHGLRLIGWWWLLVSLPAGSLPAPVLGIAEACREAGLLTRHSVLHTALFHVPQLQAFVLIQRLKKSLAWAALVRECSFVREIVGC